REVETKMTPNQGIRRSARTAVLVGLAFGLTVGLAGGLTNGLVFGRISGVPDELGDVGLWLGLGGGLYFGLVSGLTLGGYACISHLALRLVLWRAGALPLDTVRFLDYATERVFLRRV